MLKKPKHLVIGLTTFNTELLAISVPGLVKLGKKFILIIHNNNPQARVSRRQIRHLGYRGHLIIINSPRNLGLLGARLAIISRIEFEQISSEWMIFCDDDDLLINSEIPNVDENNFAIIQNSIILRHRIIDLLRIMNNPSCYTIDNENVVLDKPHLGIAGTLVRTRVMIGMKNILETVRDKISEISDSLNYLPPTDAVMWSWLNIYATHINPGAAPIYMDKQNYVITNLDSAQTKYGRPVAPLHNPRQHIAYTLSLYDKVFIDALRGTPDA